MSKKIDTAWDGSGADKHTIVKTSGLGGLGSVTAVAPRIIVTLIIIC